jgi:mannose-6-phosphate isomerase-like protein (cupin superfamily)
MSAAQTHHERTDEPAITVVSAGAGLTVRVGSEVITVIASGHDTGGAFALLEDVTEPHGGPPLHVHSREDEAFYVIAGQFLFKHGDQEVTALPGDYIFLPKGTMHTYTNAGTGPGKLLVIATPAGIEEFFVEVGQAESDIMSPPPSPTEAQLERLVAVAQTYGITVEGPPLG